MTSIVSELQLLSPSAIIELFELQTTLELHGSEEIYRFHSGVNMRQANGDIIWNGNAYSKFPIEADGFEFNGKQMPRPTLRVANLFSSITAVLLNVNAVTPGNDLIGATVTRIRTCARYLDAVNFENNQNPFGSPDPTAEAPREIYKIDRKVSENRDLIEFELAAAIDLVNVSLPGRQCISSIEAQSAATQGQTFSMNLTNRLTWLRLPISLLAQAAWPQAVSLTLVTF
jgi:lambda family phage minor tail protein L